MSYIFGNNKGKIDFDTACAPYITTLKNNLWGWFG